MSTRRADSDGESASARALGPLQVAARICRIGFGQRVQLVMSPLELHAAAGRAGLTSVPSTVNRSRKARKSDCFAAADPDRRMPGMGRWPPVTCRR